MNKKGDTRMDLTSIILLLAMGVLLWVFIVVILIIGLCNADKDK